MQPRGPLMLEHRLIERMISLIDKEIIKIEKDNVAPQSFIDTAVDFLLTYADRTHHGKEEEILFRDLSKKKLTDIDNMVMKELIQEHILSRAITAELVNSADVFHKGDKAALPLITRNLRKFVDLYPKHIEKEDTVFFPSAMTYFTESEQRLMLDEFRDFDVKMIHAKYTSVLEFLER